MSPAWRIARSAAALLLCASGVAGAQPDVWDRARDPSAAKAYDTRVAVERMLSLASDPVAGFATSRRLNRAAVAMIDLAGGAQLGDPDLDFVLGDALVSAELSREREAREVLERALQRTPSAPWSAQAWFDIAIASAKLGDSQQELDAYTHALESAWNTDIRANIFYNRGETNMVLGRLGDAVDDYSEAIRIAQSPQIQALAYYGLAIARERSSDLPSALDAAALALTIRLPVLDLPSVFFVPQYDKHYYKALGALAVARDAEDDEARLRALVAAERHWSRYLDGAVPDGHRWVDNARRHRQRALERIAELRKKP